MVFHHFTGGSKEEEAVADTGPSANVASDNMKSVKEFWTKLQTLLKDADEKEAAKFLEDTDNKLQANLDIIFFKYWNTEQLRSKECERYISVEQSLRLFDDLVRGNEDVAVPALKDYVKFKIVTGADGNDTIKAKKDEFVKAKSSAEGEKMTTEKTDEIKGKVSKAQGTSLECAIAEAEAFGVDVEEAKKKAEAAAAAKAEAAEKAKDPEKAKAKLEKDKEAAAKAVEDAKTKAEEAKKAFEEEKTKKGEEAEKTAGDDFTGELKKAIDAVLKKKDAEYKKKTFILRGAACTAFLEGTTAGLSEDEGKTISGNDFNKIMNLSASEKFDAFCGALGFPVDAFDAVAEEIKLGDEESDYVKVS